MNQERLDSDGMETERQQLNVKTTHRPKTRHVLQWLGNNGRNKTDFICSAIERRAETHLRRHGWAWTKAMAAAAAGNGEEEA